MCASDGRGRGSQVADDALPEDQQERSGEECDEHRFRCQSNARHGQSLVRTPPGEILLLSFIAP